MRSLGVELQMDLYLGKRRNLKGPRPGFGRHVRGLVADP